MSDSQLFAYDSANRLTAFVRGNNTLNDYCNTALSYSTIQDVKQGQKWTLDKAGNWIGIEERIEGQSSNNIETWVTNAFNEYTAIDSATQAHDKNGNLTDDGTSNKYHWDAFNRLVQVDNQFDQPQADFQYDALGRRAQYRDKHPSPDFYTHYYYAGQQVVEEYVALNEPDADSAELAI